MTKFGATRQKKWNAVYTRGLDVYVSTVLLPRGHIHHCIHLPIVDTFRVILAIEQFRFRSESSARLLPQDHASRVCLVIIVTTVGLDDDIKCSTTTQALLQSFPLPGHT